ncbi:Mss4-like protein [Pyrenochaeta sp. MPI-SDFR-AT-0127]|nr:Mss4-like protein [Pyrenochaeta sp. MPI-SDFR-AT-0127]
MTSSIEEDSITLTAHCLCKANVFKTDVPRSKLPLPAYVCHCDSCRHVTGAMYMADVRWPEPRAAVDISNLKPFPFSPRMDLLFCPTCSTPIFWASRQDQTRLLGVLTGALSNEKETLIKFVDQSFVGDTLDGGASVWMFHPNHDGSEMKRFRLGSDDENAEELPQQWPSPSELTGYELTKEDAIPIRCKCRGVDYVLHRGDYSKTNKEDLPFNIDPQTYKLVAEFCGCDSCRLQSGVDVFHWTFAEMKHISFRNNQPFPTHSTDLKKMIDARDPNVGTLTYYISSPGVERYFCSNCSACIFYSWQERPEILDIAIGVLEASDGARAEGLLSWTFGARIDFREDGDGGWRQNLFDKVEKEGEEYRIERAYPKNWKRLAKEKAIAKGEL